MQESPLILERQLTIAVQFGKIAFQFRTTVLRNIFEISPKNTLKFTVELRSEEGLGVSLSQTGGVLPIFPIREGGFWLIPSHIAHFCLCH